MAAHTPGPWEYVPATEHHGPYITSAFGSTICDCYVMSQPGLPSVRNGGPSRPINFLHEMAEPNARLIAAAPELLALLVDLYKHGYVTTGDHDRVRAMIEKATGEKP